MRIDLTESVSAEYQHILSPHALLFVAELQKKFNRERVLLLQKRAVRQRRFDKGELPDFLPETEVLRSGEWKVNPAPFDLCDRRVEIAGPANDAKMVIHGYNSGAKVYMSDFEDSLCPTYENIIQGQLNLYRAIRGELTYTNPEGKEYKLNEKRAVLMVRPRGWHLLEKHMQVHGRPVSASLFDFGLFVYHNAHELFARGSAPYFYLPKMESREEAGLWDNVFSFTESTLMIPHGTIKATVLIETLPAAFEMHEILYALSDHSAGLNAGRWDYIFSYIKKLREHKDRVLPDRGLVTMDKGFLAAYASLLVQTCHRRGAHAIGGMSAFIPAKDNPEWNQFAESKTEADKVREFSIGYDGTWVAHPAYVPVAQKVADRLMPGPNQLNHEINIRVGQEELLEPVAGEVTKDGLLENIQAGISYLEAWLRKIGCVAQKNRMEDLATAHVSGGQVWHWARHRVKMTNGKRVTKKLVLQLIKREFGKNTSGRFPEAVKIFAKVATSPKFIDFLTIPAYEKLLKLEKEAKNG
ncbi:MAG: malate synthase [Parcubacteria group bacterium Gr01-1014_3]|nr:MAG: malate synthase [Parcubacteria group bacterium Gr01-1014_3]